MISSGALLERGRGAGEAPAVVQVANVWKRYSGRGWLARKAGKESVQRPALRDVSLSVPQGETLGLLGPNGAGKTTLLKILSTLIEADEGSVWVLGCDASRDPRRARGMIGLVTCDERSFYWRLSGRRNLQFFATLYGLPAAKARHRIGALLERLGLTEAADRPYHSYSSGMRQKLAIARGLLSDPRLILYDEPTRSLDPISAQNIRRWIAENRLRFPETTHLIATNQLNEAEQLCDRVVILNRGEIIADGSIAHIRRCFEARQHLIHHIHCRRLPALGLTPVPGRGLIGIEEHCAEDGQTTILDIRTTAEGEALSFVLDTVLRAGATILRCETEQAPFDEIFVSLVNRAAQERSA